MWLIGCKGKIYRALISRKYFLFSTLIKYVLNIFLTFSSLIIFPVKSKYLKYKQFNKLWLQNEYRRLSYVCGFREYRFLLLRTAFEAEEPLDIKSRLQSVCPDATCYYSQQNIPELQHNYELVK